MRLWSSLLFALALTLGATPGVAAAGPVQLFGGRTVLALASFGGATYAGTDGGLLVSRGGGGWAAAGGPLQSARVNALLATPGRLYAGGDTAVLVSSDGSSWSAAGLQGHQVNALAAAGGSVFAGTGSAQGGDGAVFRSQDGGQTWAPATSLPAVTGLPGEAVQALLATGAGPVLAGTAGGGLYSSPDGVGRWSPSQQGLESPWITAVIDDGRELFAATDDGLYRSSDGGTSWSYATFPIADPWVQALVPTGPGAAVAGTYDGVVLVLSPAGWRVVAQGLPSVYVVMAYRGGYLAGTDDGLFCVACDTSAPLPRGAQGPAAGVAHPGAALRPSSRPPTPSAPTSAVPTGSPSGTVGHASTSQFGSAATIVGVVALVVVGAGAALAARRAGKGAGWP